MRRLLSVLMFSISTGLIGQNLVPNPSFENHYDCLQDAYPLTNALNWRMIESADYFNSCVIPDTSAVMIFDVPNNYYGHQFAKTGNGYGGISPYLYYNYREFAQIQLSQQLSVNKYYCVNFNVSLSDSSTWAVDKIGTYFSADTISPPPFTSIAIPPFSIFVNYIPQIESTFMISDTSNWVLINGTFQATGNEKYITIGNFRDDVDTDTLRIQTRVSSDRYSYYIDDISVEEVLSANAGRDTSITSIDSVQLGNNPTENATYLWQPTIGLNDANAANPMARPNTTTTYIVTKTQCSVVTSDSVIVYNLSVGINGNSNDSFKLYPNPTEGQFTFSGLKKESTIEIFDVAGRLIYKTVSTNEKQTVNLADKEKGIYFYRVTNETGNVRQGKIILH